jgi:hypothetical protein
MAGERARPLFAGDLLRDSPTFRIVADMSILKGLEAVLWTRGGCGVAISYYNPTGELAAYPCRGNPTVVRELKIRDLRIQPRRRLRKRLKRTKMTLD